MILSSEFQKVLPTQPPNPLTSRDAVTSRKGSNDEAKILFLSATSLYIKQFVCLEDIEHTKIVLF